MTDFTNSLMHRLSRIEARGNAIEENLGTPQRVLFCAIRRRVVEGTLVAYTHTIIPNAHVTRVPDKMVGMFFDTKSTNLTVSKSDLLIEFPRCHFPEFANALSVDASGTSEFLLDINIDEDNNVTEEGTVIRIISILSDDLLCWQIIGRKLYDG
jgi:hypothetical protein